MIDRGGLTDHDSYLDSDRNVSDGCILHGWRWNARSNGKETDKATQRYEVREVQHSKYHAQAQCGEAWRILGERQYPRDIKLTRRTTFVSAVFATLNSLSLQEYVARWISDYMTSETGVTVM